MNVREVPKVIFHVLVPESEVRPVSDLFIGHPGIVDEEYDPGMGTLLDLAGSPAGGIWLRYHEWNNSTSIAVYPDLYHLLSSTQKYGIACHLGRLSAGSFETGLTSAYRSSRRQEGLAYDCPQYSNRQLEQLPHIGLCLEVLGAICRKASEIVATGNVEMALYYDDEINPT